LSGDNIFLPVRLCLKAGINEHVILKGSLFYVKENKKIKPSQPFEAQGQKILPKKHFPFHPVLPQSM